jgi:hypothetical protein
MQMRIDRSLTSMPVQTALQNMASNSRIYDFCETAISPRSCEPGISNIRLLDQKDKHRHDVTIRSLRTYLLLEKSLHRLLRIPRIAINSCSLPT